MSSAFWIKLKAFDLWNMALVEAGATALLGWLRGGLLLLFSVFAAALATTPRFTEEINAAIWAPVTGFFYGLILAVLFNFAAGMRFVNGMDALVEGPSGLSASGEFWVRIKRVGVVNQAKLSAILGIGGGLVLGLVYAAAFLLGLQLSPASVPAPFAAIGSFIALFLFIPLAIIFFGVATAFIDNFVFNLPFLNGLHMKLLKTGDGEYRLMRVGAVNLGKYFGLLYGVIGVPIGLIAALLLFFSAGPIALLAIPLVPAFFGFVGFFHGSITACALNFVFRLPFVNGLKMRIGLPFASRRAAASATASRRSSADRRPPASRLRKPPARRARKRK